MKEIWEVRPEVHRQGQVTHTMGWPLRTEEFGGAFIYALSDTELIVGLVIVGMLVATGWGLAERSTGVRAGVLAYGDITPTSITITLEVVRDPDQPVLCDVAAVGDLQIDVGAARVEVPTGGGERAVVRSTIETASPPKAARLLTCRPVEPG